MNVSNGVSDEVNEYRSSAVQNVRQQRVSYVRAADGNIYFASERDGTFNLWRMSPKGGTAQSVTTFKSGGVFFPSISPDGKKIVFQNDFDLYTVDLPSGKREEAQHHAGVPDPERL